MRNEGMKNEDIRNSMDIAVALQIRVRIRSPLHMHMMIILCVSSDSHPYH